jgi:opacity protein-like surface antigen
MTPVRRRRLASTVLGLCASGAAMAVAAAEPLGLYVGGAIGQGAVAANVPNPNVPVADFPIPTSDTFNQEHFAFKLMAGARPVQTLGAEFSYLNLGSPNGSLFGHPASASMKGESAFGVLYLPVPLVDVFAKAGVARIQSTVSGFAPDGIPDFVCMAGVPCGTSPLRQDRTDTRFAAGAGLQVRLDAWAVRAEYERFDAAGENPYLLSVGLTWSF